MSRFSWPSIAMSLLATASALRAAEPPRAASKSGIDASFVDPKIRPQDDLFRHVNGKWLAETPIPPDRPLDGAFYKLRDKSEADLRSIIEQTAAKSDSPPGSEAQKVGDLYASFLDEAQADRLGSKPLVGDFLRISQIQSKADLVREMALFGREGVEVAFNGSVDTDAKHSDRYIIYLAQAGLGLPDESYYRVENFKAIRDAYVDHIAKMFALIGPGGHREAAEQVMALETRLAKDHWDRVKSRDDTLTYNKKDLKALGELTPGFDWNAWLKATGVRGVDEVVVRQPSYFAAMAKALDEVPLEHWKKWLAWSVLRSNAPYLSKPFVDENFAFYGQDADRHAGDQAAVEARGRRGRGVARRGRWASSTSRRSSRPPPRPGCSSSSPT